MTFFSFILCTYFHLTQSLHTVTRMWLYTLSQWKIGGCVMINEGRWVSVCLCENGWADGRRKDGGKTLFLCVGSAISAPGFIWTAVCTEKVTQIQISQKSKSWFVIKFFNILKCCNWRKHKNSPRKQKLAQEVQLTDLSSRFKKSHVVVSILLFVSIQDLRKKKTTTSYISLLNKNIQCKKVFPMSQHPFCFQIFFLFTEWQDELDCIIWCSMLGLKGKNRAS